MESHSNYSNVSMNAWGSDSFVLCNLFSDRPSGEHLAQRAFHNSVFHQHLNERHTRSSRIPADPFKEQPTELASFLVQRTQRLLIVLECAKPHIDRIALSLFDTLSQQPGQVELDHSEQKHYVFKSSFSCAALKTPTQPESCFYGREWPLHWVEPGCIAAANLPIVGLIKGYLILFDAFDILTLTHRPCGGTTGALASIARPHIAHHVDGKLHWAANCFEQANKQDEYQPGTFSISTDIDSKLTQFIFLLVLFFS